MTMMSHASHIATVRQFARAIFADRLIGDELTRLALAKVNIDPKSSTESLPDLLHAFLHTWRMASSGRRSEESLFSDGALLAALPVPPGNERLMLLLVDVMNFTPETAAEIIAVKGQDPHSILDKGRQVISLPRSAKAIIIEDEPLIAADLREIMTSIGVEVCGEANTADKAISMSQQKKPNIILADYNLIGMKTGADAVMEIQDSLNCPVVFITGYPEQVLTGEDVEPDFVIAKPYRIESVKAAVAHCLDVERAQIMN